jgi:hypothetical protein
MPVTIYSSAGHHFCVNALSRSSVPEYHLNCGRTWSWDGHGTRTFGNGLGAAPVANSADQGTKACNLLEEMLPGETRSVLHFELFVHTAGSDWMAYDCMSASTLHAWSLNHGVRNPSLKDCHWRIIVWEHMGLS